MTLATTSKDGNSESTSKRICYGFFTANSAEYLNPSLCVLLGVDFSWITPRFFLLKTRRKNFSHVLLAFANSTQRFKISRISLIRRSLYSSRSLFWFNRRFLSISNSSARTSSGMEGGSVWVGRGRRLTAGLTVVSSKRFSFNVMVKSKAKEKQRLGLGSGLGGRFKTLVLWNYETNARCSFMRRGKVFNISEWGRGSRVASASLIQTFHHSTW